MSKTKKIKGFSKKSFNQLMSQSIKESMIYSEFNHKDVFTTVLTL